jgi:hypothetical protein
MPIYTAQDVCDYLMAGTGGGAQDAEHRIIRGAVHHSYRDVCEGRDWLWHVKTGTFTTTGGTFTVYNHDGTSSTLTVTADINQYASVGDTINDPNQGFIPANTTITTISANTSTITVNGQSVVVRTITISSSPTGVLVSVFVVPKSDYDLPTEVKNLDALLSRNIGTLRFYITPTDYLRMQVNSSPAGDPFYFTVMRIGDNQNLTVRFVGQPTAQLPFQYVYRKRPDPLVLMGFEPRCRAGTVTVANGATTVTGAGGAAFTADMVGAIIRFSRDSTNYPESQSGLYPYAFEARIVSITNSTTLVIDTAAPQAFTAVKYYISDALDVSPAMYTACLSGAELWYARMAGKSAEQPLALYGRDMRLAMEGDVTNPLSGRREGWLEFPLTPRLAGYYSVQLPDAGT